MVATEKYSRGLNVNSRPRPNMKLEGRFISVQSRQEVMLHRPGIDHNAAATSPYIIIITSVIL